MTTPTLRLTVTGMTCGHCERAVKQAVLAVDAQAQVHIDRAQNLVEIESQADSAALIAAIKEEGYATEVL